MSRTLLPLAWAALVVVLALAPAPGSASTATFRNSAELTIPGQGTAQLPLTNQPDQGER